MNIRNVFILLKYVVELLVSKHYEEIFKNDYKKLISAKDIEDAINEYPGVLSMPPTDMDLLNFNLDFMDIDEAQVEFRLWYDHEESDLAMRLNIYIDDDENYRYCLYGLLVP